MDARQELRNFILENYFEEKKEIERQSPDQKKGLSKLAKAGIGLGTVGLISAAVLLAKGKHKGYEKVIRSPHSSNIKDTTDYAKKYADIAAEKRVVNNKMADIINKPNVPKDLHVKRT